LQRCFGEQLWEAGTALGSSFGKLSGTTLRINYFEEHQLWGAAFGDNFTNYFGEQLLVATLWSNFGEQLSGLTCDLGV